MAISSWDCFVSLAMTGGIIFSFSFLVVGVAYGWFIIVEYVIIVRDELGFVMSSHPAGVRLHSYKGD